VKDMSQEADDTTISDGCTYPMNQLFSTTFQAFAMPCNRINNP
jgi:hypothetical protein